MVAPSRLVSLVLGGGCALLVLVTATSMVGDDGPADAGAPVDSEQASAEPPVPEDCYGALGYFSGDDQNARYVVWRESRNEPTAQNPRSSAAGCFQLTVRHAWRFEEVGCSWAERYEPVCNTKAADHLFRDAGWAPWKIG